MSWLADATRYDRMQYRYCGKSGLQLPLLSLGLWHNFSHGHALDDQRACCARPLTWALPISIWRITTGRRPAAQRKILAACCARILPPIAKS